MWSSFTVFGVGVVFTTAMSAAFSAPKFFLLRLGTLLAVYFLAVRWSKIQKVVLAKHQAGWLGIILVIVFFLTTFRSSTNLLSQSKFFEYLSWLLFFLVCWGGTSSEKFTADDPTFNHDRDLSFTILECLGIPLVVYGFMQHWNLDPIQWYPGGRQIFSTVGNAGAYAGLQAALLGITMMRFLKKSNILRFLLIEAETAALTWTYVRAPLFAFILAGLMIFSLLLAFKRTHLSKFLLVFLAALITSGLLLGYSHGTAEGKRIKPSTWNKDPDVLGRKYLFAKGFELFALNPWKGIGAGNFSWEYLKLRQDDPPFYKTRIGVGESTHNTFLDVAVEAGWIGGVCFLLVWVFTVSRLYLALRNSAQDEQLLIFTYLFPIFVLFISFQFLYPEPSTEALSGFLLGTSALANPSHFFQLRMTQKLRLGIVMAALCLLLAGTIYTVDVVMADWYAGEGKQASARDDFKGAIGSYNAALQWNRWNPSLYQALGKVYEQNNDSNHAFLNYKAAVQINPKNPFVWADLGRLAAIQHLRSLALTSYVHAIQLDPYNPIWYHDAALSALNLRAFPMALFCSREMFRLNPEDSQNALLLAHSLLASGRSKEAEVFLDAQIVRFSENVELRELKKKINR